MKKTQKRKLSKGSVIKSPWHRHGPGDDPIIAAESPFLAGYKEELKKLNGLLVDFYGSHQKQGILTYADIARNPQFDILLDHIRESVDEAFRLRSKVIRAGLRAAADKAYTDILYQAERLAYVGVVSKNKTNILPMSARDKQAESYGTHFQSERFEEWAKNGTDGRIPLDADMDRKNEYGKEVLTDKLRVALSGDGVDLDKWRKILVDELSKDASRFLSVLHTQGSRAINTAVHTAFESNYMAIVQAAIAEKSTQKGLCLRWLHDEPRTPRQWHITQLHDTVPDIEGYWWSTGTGELLRATGVGEFYDDREDNYCRCYHELCNPYTTRGMSTRKGIVPVPADYIQRRIDAGSLQAGKIAEVF